MQSLNGPRDHVVYYVRVALGMFNRNGEIIEGFSAQKPWLLRRAVLASVNLPEGPEWRLSTLSHLAHKCKEQRMCLKVAMRCPRRS